MSTMKFYFFFYLNKYMVSIEETWIDPEMLILTLKHVYSQGIY